MRIMKRIIFAGILLQTPLLALSETTGESPSERFARITDQELFDRLATAEIPQLFHLKDKIHREAILVEMTRRGGDAMAKQLREKLWLDRRKISNAKQQLDAMTGDRRLNQHRIVERLENQIDLFTALRRIEKKDDPIAITFLGDTDKIVGQTRKLPTVHVALKNVYVNRQPIFIKQGGDYRSGRHA